MSAFLQSFKQFFSPLSTAQKTLFAIFTIGLISLMSLLFYWALQPSYTVLFGSLAPDSAQTIVEELQSMGVGYELRDNGRTIMVPRNQVYDLRLQFASEGAAGTEYQGYELFDQNALGMTDFMQRINKKRALEGELSRTVNSLQQVESSRIHIVLPERSPFQESTVDPSASVILNLRKGQKLGQDQIEGIGSLIAGSVEGLNLENVVILDQIGNRISENVLINSDVATSSAHMKVRQDTENYLTVKGQSMLDRVLGTGNSILRVSTEHNFDRLIRESNKVDPETRVVVSEEKRSSTNTNRTQEPSGSVQSPQGDPVTTSSRDDESTVQVKNYEMNTTNEQFEKTVGEITRISASVLLNYKSETTQNEDGEEVTEPTPYSDEEIEEIRNVMRSALGIQDQRGDVLTITQIRFQDPYANTNYEDNLFSDPLSTYEIIRWVLIALVVGVVLLLAYRTTNSMGGSQENSLFALEGKRSGSELGEGEGKSEKYLSGATDDTGGEGGDIYTEKLSEEAQKELATGNQVSRDIDEFVTNNPRDAAVLVKSLINKGNI